MRSGVGYRRAARHIRGARRLIFRIPEAVPSLGICHVFGGEPFNIDCHDIRRDPATETPFNEFV
jgi:hypothetical protein